MASIGWSLLAVLVAFTAQAKCQSTTFPVIPKHLLECYQDDGVYHRANRMPSSLDFFLDLLRKVEGSPTSKNMNARELSLALLQYLKLDGIQSTQPQTKYVTSNILPFAPSGAEYFKHRLTLIGLLPRIDQGYMTAFNESLTKKEMCELHFMLSYSIDPYKRSDEKCSPLFEESRKIDIPNMNPDWPGRDHYRRHRRQTDQEKKRGTDSSGKRSNRISPEEKLGRSRRHDEGGKKLEVEEIPIHEKEHGKVSHEEKDKFTIGAQELLSDNERHLEVGMQSLIQGSNFGRFGGRSFGISSEDSPFSGVVPGVPLSDCPVVNGVITTPFGSLTIGTVIAGIAAGLNPEEIPPMRLSVDPAELESPSDRVKNIWATTLSGTVADTLSSPAVTSMDSLQILKGGWNDSTDPKWYLLSSSDFKHLPEVTLRGSLDGFLLGTTAKQWTDRWTGIKLSQMLQMYYEYVLGGVGARDRVQIMPKYAPEELFRKQTYLMSLVLKKQKTQTHTVLNYSPIVRAAVSKVTQHIQTMGENHKSYIGSFLSTTIDSSVNMIAVIDSSWGHENLLKLFEVLRSAQVALTAVSNLTVLCGKDGKILVSSTNGAHFRSLFTKDTLMENCTRGMDLPLVFGRLDNVYRKIFFDEKMSQKMITASQVVLLLPYEPLLQDNAYVVEKSENFRSNFPDVRLMVASAGRGDSFRPLVKDPKDLFSISFPFTDPELKSLKELAHGVKQSFHRLSRPSCGSYFDDDSQGPEIQVTRNIPPGDIAYYRLLPQYFYTQHGLVTITVRSKQRSPLTVCHSREEERPIGPSVRTDPGNDYTSNRFPDYRTDFPPEASPYGRQTSDVDGRVTCKTITSEAYKIEMNNPCEGSSLHDCLPLYISLSPPLQETFSISCTNCWLPINVEYEIVAAGLTCYNSAAINLVSPILLSLLLLRYFIV